MKGPTVSIYYLLKGETEEGEKGADAEDVGGMMKMMTVMMNAVMIAYSKSRQRQASR